MATACQRLYADADRRRRRQEEEARLAAERLAAESGGVLMHPFDMQDAWDGHASLVQWLCEF